LQVKKLKLDPLNVPIWDSSTIRQHKPDNPRQRPSNNRTNQHQTPIDKLMRIATKLGWDKEDVAPHTTIQVYRNDEPIIDLNDDDLKSAIRLMEIQFILGSICNGKINNMSIQCKKTVLEVFDIEKKLEENNVTIIYKNNDGTINRIYKNRIYKKRGGKSKRKHCKTCNYTRKHQKP